jgi:flagellar L-ring protein precursor FlgH
MKRGLSLRMHDAAGALWRARIGVLAIAATVAVGCSSIKPTELNKAPDLSPVGAGMAQQPVAPATYDTVHRAAYRKPEGHNSASLWTSRGSDLFRDRRARRLGDILTVTISIKDKAIMDNRSKRSRDSAHGFGLDWAHGLDVAGLKSEGKAAVASGL